MTARVLVLCTANSARSQMGEGLLRDLSNGSVDVYSAGSNPSSVNPFAIKAMLELGIDISNHKSESVQKYTGMPFDFVITVCDSAAETCPVFPGKSQRLHWSIPDPAGVSGDETAILTAFRNARDELRERLETFIKEFDLLT